MGRGREEEDGRRKHLELEQWLVELI